MVERAVVCFGTLTVVGAGKRQGRSCSPAPKGRSRVAPWLALCAALYLPRKTVTPASPRSTTHTALETLSPHLRPAPLPAYPSQPLLCTSASQGRRGRRRELPARMLGGWTGSTVQITERRNVGWRRNGAFPGVLSGPKGAAPPWLAHSGDMRLVIGGASAVDRLGLAHLVH